MSVNLPFFLQSRQWSDFWIQANPKDHKKHEVIHQFAGYRLQAIIYEYPYFFNTSFFYIPKGPILLQLNTAKFTEFPKSKKEEINENQLNEDLLKDELKKFYAKVVQLAKENQILFLKHDFDETVSKYAGFQNNRQIKDFFEKELKQKALLDVKSLQYLQTIVLDCRDIRLLPSKQIVTDSDKVRSPISIHSQDLNNIDFQKFFELNNDFWKRTNQNVRRYTRKSLQKNWHINIDKTPGNFEDAWKLLNQTGQRQEFHLHTKEYLETLFNQDFSRVIVLRDQNGLAHACWIGIILNRNVVYLYGGNTEYSLKNYGQYLLHLVVTWIVAAENSNEPDKVRYYDLGGYSEEKGYGKFKQNYRGETKSWLGPVDLVYETWKYHLIMLVIQFTRFLKNK